MAETKTELHLSKEHSFPRSQQHGLSQSESEGVDQKNNGNSILKNL